MLLLIQGEAELNIAELMSKTVLRGDYRRNKLVFLIKREKYEDLTKYVFREEILAELFHVRNYTYF